MFEFLTVAAFAAFLGTSMFSRVEKERSDGFYFKIICKVESMYAIVQKLAAVEKLITDIEICNPDELEKTIRCDWVSAGGEHVNYDLWIDGRNGTTESMLQLAYNERASLRSALLKEARKFGRTV